MQNQNLPLLSISRENYKVPKGEERVVHYKAERVLYTRDGMTRLSKPALIKTNVKMFDEVKRNLEVQGYTIEILYHPQGKYTNVVIPQNPTTVLAEKEAQLEAKNVELDAKDAEIARLKAELAKAKKSGKEEIAIEKEDQEEGKTPDSEEAIDITLQENDGEDAPKKKSGRPKKS